MDTVVVNVKVAYIRPEYKDLREWCADPNNVYIGRQGVVFVEKVRYPPKASIWANPFKVGKNCTREEAIAKYTSYIEDKLAKDPLLREELEHLRGKRLGCWCKPEACHGDVLISILNK